MPLITSRKLSFWMPTPAKSPAMPAVGQGGPPPAIEDNGAVGQNVLNTRHALSMAGKMCELFCYSGERRTVTGFKH